MREFDYSKIKNIKWDNTIVSYIAGIYYYAGKQELYLKQRSQDLQKLIEITKIQSTESSNAIEGIITTSARVKKLVQEKAEPKSRNELEIAGYIDALNTINESFEYIPLSKNYILQLHSMLYKYTNNSFGGKMKNSQNYIKAFYKDGHQEVLFTPLDAFDTPIAIDKICNEYNKAINEYQIEPLILIPIFIHDFLCIHPFNDGNGRMSRLLTTLLLYKSKFFVGKYISLENIIAKSKDGYYASLNKSQNNWLEGKEDPTPFIKYILSTIYSAYKDLQERCDIIGEKIPAIDIVRNAINVKVGKFTKQDIIELCPNISKSSIEIALRQLVENKEIHSHGQARATFYTKKA